MTEKLKSALLTIASFCQDYTDCSQCPLCKTSQNKWTNENEYVCSLVNCMPEDYIFIIE